MHVSAGKFNIDRLSFSIEGDNESRRVVLKYDYIRKGINNLHLSLDKGCYMLCKGVYEETFGKDNKKTGKHTTTFIINKGDNNLYEVLLSIFNAVQKYERARAKTRVVNFPVRESEDSDMCFIYGRFVEGNDGKMYTKAFDRERNDIEVTNLQKCMSRPLFSISYPITSLDKVNIRFSVFEMEIDRMLGSNYSLLDDDQDEP